MSDFFFGDGDALSPIGARWAPGPPVGMGEAASTAFHLQFLEGTQGIPNLLAESYDPIQDAVIKDARARGMTTWDTQGYANPYRTGDQPEQQDARVAKIWDYIGKRRQQDPSAFNDLPQDHEKILERAHNDLIDARERYSAIQDREGILGSAGDLAGGFVGGMADPVNLGLTGLTFPLGGIGIEGKGLLIAARKLMQQGILGASINAASSAATVPGINEWRKKVGLPEITEDEALGRVGDAAKWGFILGAGGSALHSGASAAMNAFQRRGALLAKADELLTANASPEARVITGMTDEQLAKVYALAVKGNAPVEVVKDGKRLFIAPGTVSRETASSATAAERLNRAIEDDQSNPIGTDSAEKIEHADRQEEAVQALKTGEPLTMPTRPLSPPAVTKFPAPPPILDRFDPDELLVDAKTFQFKEGGDDTGVTSRLKGVKEWEPGLSGKVIVYETAATARPDIEEAGPPPPAKGFVRFFHGGAADPASGGGRWVSERYAYAQGYADKSGGKVFYVDIPEHDLIGKVNKSFEDEGTDQRAPYVHHEVSEAIAAQMKPVQRRAAPAGGAPAYSYEPFDVAKPTGGKVFYHGTKAPIEALKNADVLQFSRIENLYGEGLYLTDNPNVARSYAERKGSGPAGKVLGARLGDLNLVDLEAPLSGNARAIFDRFIEAENGDPAAATASGKDVFDALKQAMQDNDLTKSGAVEIYQNLSQELTQAGYDGLRHQGGDKRGGLGSHNVVILFEDAAVPAKRPLSAKFEDHVVQAEGPKRFIVDGHQRVALAKRAKAAGQKDVYLDGELLKEGDIAPDGSVVDVSYARTRAARKNIAEGSGTAVDAAKLMRELGSEKAALAMENMPPQSAIVQAARGMAKLSKKAWSMVVNGIVPDSYAGAVGRLVKRADEQEAIMGLLAKAEPANQAQAESMIRQALEAGFERRGEETLFGNEVVADALFSERAKVLDRALRTLRDDKKLFASLTNNATTIEGEGNVLARDLNARRSDVNAQALQHLQVLAHRRGPISEALTAAAKRAKADGRFDRAARDFADAVRREAAGGNLDGGPGRGTGRLDEAQGNGQGRTGMVREAATAAARADEERLKAPPPSPKEEDAIDTNLNEEISKAIEDGVINGDVDLPFEDGTMTVKAALRDANRRQRLADTALECANLVEPPTE